MLYKCDICEKEFKQKSHYIDHLNRIRPCIKLTENPSKLHVFPQKSMIKCSYCYKTYSRPDVLKIIY